MSGESYRPIPEELMYKAPSDVESETREQAEKSGEDLCDVLPKNIQEKLEDSRHSVELALEDAFGEKEVPKELEADMQEVLNRVAREVKKEGFQEEISSEAYADLQQLALRIANYKKPIEVDEIKSDPEVGWRVVFTDERGKTRERAFTDDEEQILQSLETWSDDYNQLENIKNFKNVLKTARAESAKEKDEQKQATVLKKVLYRKYEGFGFTRPQIEKLALLTDSETLVAMTPTSKDPNVHQMEVLMETWQEYLGPGEKTTYAKFAAGVIATGMAEGVAPSIMRYMMDSDTAMTAALFGLGYFGSEAVSGFAKKKIAVNFDTFVESVMKKPGGVYERIAGDLAFQPGEKMSETEDRGRLMSAVKRSQEAFRDLLRGTATVTAPAVASAATGIGLLMAQDWRLGLISLGGGAISYAVMEKAKNKAVPLIHQTYKTEDDLTMETEQQLLAHKEIVLNNMRDAMTGRMEESMEKLGGIRAQRSANRKQIEFVSGSVVGASVMAAITVAGVALREFGVIHDAGTIVAALVYSGLFRRAFDQIMYQQEQFLDSCKSMAEMEEIFNGFATQEITEDKNRVDVGGLKDFSILLKDLQLDIDEKTLIEDVSIQIPAGGTVRFKGMSGHGKTTLTKLITGYYTPTSGEVRIGDTPVSDIKKTGPESLYSRTAYLPQDPYLFDGSSLRENLSFGNEDVSDQEIIRVLEELGLKKRFMKKGAIDLEGSIKGLSGGEKTRVGFARTVLKIRKMEKDGIVFLDEPTGGLDVSTEKEIASVLVQEKAKHPDVTFVIISHSESFIKELQKPHGEAPGFDIQSIRIHEGKIQSENEKE